MKTWSYRQITDETERQIISLMEEAARRHREGGEPYRQWAYGVYLGWERLTCGWRTEGDDDRMKALMEWKGGG